MVSIQERVIVARVRYLASVYFTDTDFCQIASEKIILDLQFKMRGLKVL
jgi:hypothetical protein